VVGLARVKIYELAKELSVESKEIIRKLNKLGIEAKTHMSTISVKDADMIRSSFAAGETGKQQGISDDFVPRVKRIPKAVIVQEQNALAVEENKNGEAAAADSPTPNIDKAPLQEKDESAVLLEHPLIKEKPEKEKSVSTPAVKRDKEDTGLPAEKAPLEKVAQKTFEEDETGKEKIRDIKEKDFKEKVGPNIEAKPEESVKKAKGPESIKREDRSRQARPKETRNQNSIAKKEETRGERPQNNRPQNNKPQGERGPAPKPQGDRAKGDKTQGAKPAFTKAKGDKTGVKVPKDGASSFTPEAKPAKRPNKKVFVKDLVFERNSEEENFRSRGFNKGNKGKGRKDHRGKKETKTIMPPVTPKKITIGETVILGELAKTMGKTAGEIIKKLLDMGIMATINQELDAETAILLADEFGVTVEVRADRAAEIMEDLVDEEGDLHERPPVVTIMGHVDHGKTSLLDAIRHTNVVSGEAGGITQHIGAYQVEIKGKRITFLDTPGHEAFTAMRARGANMTDIAIIVVAADDGVMPQTVEAINHSKAAHVPIIIAINKIDKEGADPSRVKQELTEYGLVAEEWGGDTIMVEVSAKAKLNLEGLLEMILLVAEVAELKANYERAARGAVVEAKLDKNRGPVATLLVQKGTLNEGDIILASAAFGKVRAMHDDKGRKVKSAGPSTPVEVLGFSEVPPAGEIFIVVKDERDARLVAVKQGVKKREEELHKVTKVSLDNLFQQIAEGEIKELNLVVKADVQGSVEALIQSLVKLNTDEVKVNVIHSGVGAISESDVMLSSASNAIILGFNIIAPPAARTAAETANVDIRLYRVIYDALEDIKLAMSGLLAPEFKENIIGHVEIRQIIRVPKVGLVAGSYVTNGKVIRNASARVIRDGAVIAEDKVVSLRRFKDDAKEVLQGFECGISLENFQDIKEGDEIEVYVIEEIARQL
jgi:translation initiation factor IF-2